uniref:AB hydrolase-1 domain-containing protein n=1 Tax=Chromera velia CCMP2878 TaxID=1169474 RepID=A0A0G4F5R8_9ALVE|eukprot:Cvel_15316.t1-p1 / transcript=Cvel_15316.t1 / gene=Cvel_15316 / organism=Chromera_velia_CCMP2878 / gene_product=Serine hydrolase-like protein, putative / transcript_product=Serine hydrolase-like protein, putative / location=Cvel_scaffold1126:12528-23993(+) / protein_length=2121 / sequence_SO=supercontig / SO=protein_coding / is_pseudo=false
MFAEQIEATKKGQQSAAEKGDLSQSAADNYGLPDCAVPKWLDGIKCPFPRAKFMKGKHGNINYDLSGMPRGPLVVCLHGLNGTRQTFQDLQDVSARRSGFRLLTFDFYGHGLSSAPRHRPGKKTYGLKFFVDQVNEVLEQESLMEERLDLVGFSMGCCIAIAYAYYFPEKVKKLALISPAGFLQKKPVPLKLLQGCPCCVGCLPGCVSRCCFRKKGFAKKFSANEKKNGLVDALWNRMMWQLFVKKGMISAFLGCVTQIPMWNLEPMAKQVGACDRAVLLFWGKQDTVCPVEVAGKVQECFANSHLITFSPCSHLVLADQPAGSIFSILRFLTFSDNASMSESSKALPFDESGHPRSLLPPSPPRHAGGAALPLLARAHGHAHAGMRGELVQPPRPTHDDVSPVFSQSPVRERSDSGRKAEGGGDEGGEQKEKEKTDDQEKDGRTRSSPSRTAGLSVARLEGGTGRMNKTEVEKGGDLGDGVGCLASSSSSFAEGRGKEEGRSKDIRLLPGARGDFFSFSSSAAAAAAEEEETEPQGEGKKGGEEARCSDREGVEWAVKPNRGHGNSSRAGGQSEQDGEGQPVVGRGKSPPLRPWIGPVVSPRTPSRQERESRDRDRENFNSGRRITSESGKGKTKDGETTAERERLLEGEGKRNSPPTSQEGVGPSPLRVSNVKVVPMPPIQASARPDSFARESLHTPQSDQGRGRSSGSAQKGRGGERGSGSSRPFSAQEPLGGTAAHPEGFSLPPQMIVSNSHLSSTPPFAHTQSSPSKRDPLPPRTVVVAGGAGSAEPFQQEIQQKETQTREKKRMILSDGWGPVSPSPFSVSRHGGRVHLLSHAREEAAEAEAEADSKAASLDSSKAGESFEDTQFPISGLGAFLLDQGKAQAHRASTAYTYISDETNEEIPGPAHPKAPPVWRSSHVSTALLSGGAACPFTAGPSGGLSLSPSRRPSVAHSSSAAAGEPEEKEKLRGAGGRVLLLKAHHEQTHHAVPPSLSLSASSSLNASLSLSLPVSAPTKQEQVQTECSEHESSAPAVTGNLQGIPGGASGGSAWEWEGFVRPSLGGLQTPRVLVRDRREREGRSASAGSKGFPPRGGMGLGFGGLPQAVSSRGEGEAEGVPLKQQRRERGYSAGAKEGGRPFFRQSATETDASASSSPPERKIDLDARGWEIFWGGGGGWGRSGEGEQEGEGENGGAFCPASLPPFSSAGGGAEVADEGEVGQRILERRGGQTEEEEKSKVKGEREEEKRGTLSFSGPVSLFNAVSRSAHLPSNDSSASASSLQPTSSSCDHKRKEGHENERQKEEETAVREEGHVCPGEPTPRFVSIAKGEEGDKVRRYRSVDPSIFPQTESSSEVSKMKENGIASEDMKKTLQSLSEVQQKIQPDLFAIHILAPKPAISPPGSAPSLSNYSAGDRDRELPLSPSRLPCCETQTQTSSSPAAVAHAEPPSASPSVPAPASLTDSRPQPVPDCLSPSPSSSPQGVLSGTTRASGGTLPVHVAGGGGGGEGRQGLSHSPPHLLQQQPDCEGAWEGGEGTGGPSESLLQEEFAVFLECSHGLGSSIRPSAGGGRSGRQRSKSRPRAAAREVGVGGVLEEAEAVGEKGREKEEEKERMRIAASRRRRAESAVHEMKTSLTGNRSSSAVSYRPSCLRTRNGQRQDHPDEEEENMCDDEDSHSSASDVRCHPHSLSLSRTQTHQCSHQEHDGGEKKKHNGRTSPRPPTPLESSDRGRGRHKGGAPLQTDEVLPVQGGGGGRERERGINHGQKRGKEKGSETQPQQNRGIQQKSNRGLGGWGWRFGSRRASSCSSTSDLSLLHTHSQPDAPPTTLGECKGLQLSHTEEMKRNQWKGNGNTGGGGGRGKSREGGKEKEWTGPRVSWVDPLDRPRSPFPLIRPEAPPPSAPADATAAGASSSSSSSSSSSAAPDGSLHSPPSFAFSFSAHENKNKAGERVLHGIEEKLPPAGEWKPTPTHAPHTQKSVSASAASASASSSLLCFSPPSTNKNEKEKEKEGRRDGDGGSSGGHTGEEEEPTARAAAVQKNGAVTQQSWQQTVKRKSRRRSTESNDRREKESGDPIEKQDEEERKDRGVKGQKEEEQMEEESFLHAPLSLLPHALPSPRPN